MNPSQTTDISTIGDIKLMVDEFYTAVRNDELLKDIFNSRIGDRWPEHLDKMYWFWQTVLLDDHTYFGSPFIPHATMNISKPHFDRWTTLFNHTVDVHFKGPIAQRAKWQGERMALMFQTKIEMIKMNGTTPIK